MDHLSPGLGALLSLLALCSFLLVVREQTRGGCRPRVLASKSRPCGTVRSRADCLQFSDSSSGKGARPSSDISSSVAVLQIREFIWRNRGGAGAEVGLTLLSMLTHSFDSSIRYIFQLSLVLPW